MSPLFTWTVETWKCIRRRSCRRMRGWGKQGKIPTPALSRHWEEKEQNRGIEKCPTFIFLPFCFYQHYIVQVNFNSLEQCSNTRVALPSRVTGLGQWSGRLAGLSPAHMDRTGSDPNINALTRVRPKPKCIEPGVT